MSKKILVVLSEWGYWGEELVGPLEAFDEAGLRRRLRDADRQAPGRDRRRAWTPTTSTRRSAARSPRRRWPRRSRRSTRRPRLDNPLEPLRADPRAARTTASDDFLRKQEAYYKRARREAKELVDKYDAILIVGGSGPDRRPRQQPARPRPDPRLLRRRQADRRRVLRRRLPRLRPRLGGPQEHHLGQARHRPLHRVRLQGRHRLHRHRTSTWARRRTRSSTSCATPPRPTARYHGNVGHETSVIVDYPFITGRSTPDSYLTGEKMVEVLEDGLTPVGLVAERGRARRADGDVEWHRRRVASRSSSSCSPTASRTCSATPARSSRGSSTRSASYPDMRYILTLQETIAVAIARRLRPRDAAADASSSSTAASASATASA